MALLGRAELQGTALSRLLQHARVRVVWQPDLSPDFLISTSGRGIVVLGAQQLQCRQGRQAAALRIEQGLGKCRYGSVLIPRTPDTVRSGAYDELQARAAVAGVQALPTVSGVDSEAAVIAVLVKHARTRTRTLASGGGGGGRGGRSGGRGRGASAPRSVNDRLVACVSAIPGVGTVSAKRLLQHAGSLAHLAAMSPKAIAASGVSTAPAVHAFFNPHPHHRRGSSAGAGAGAAIAAAAPVAVRPCGVPDAIA